MTDNNRPGHDDDVPRYGTREYADWYARHLQNQHGVDRLTPGGPTPPKQKPSIKAVSLIVGLVVAVAVGVIIGVTAIGTKSSRTGGAAASPATSTTLNANQLRSTGSSSATPTATPAPASPIEDFATIYAHQHSGVVRIDVVGCSDTGVGTGFLLSPTLVATVNHVVAGAVVVGLTDEGQRTTGQVIGSDPAHDLALVRTAHPLTGYHFHIASATPRIGDPVAAIGFPIGGPITLTQGGVSGLDRIINVDGRTETGMVETDAPLNPATAADPC